MVRGLPEHQRGVDNPYRLEDSHCQYDVPIAFVDERPFHMGIDQMEYTV